MEKSKQRVEQDYARNAIHDYETGHKKAAKYENKKNKQWLKKLKELKYLQLVKQQLKESLKFGHQLMLVVGVLDVLKQVDQVKWVKRKSNAKE